VYHDNAPEQPEELYLRGEYTANAEMARRSGWLMLPAARVPQTGTIAVLSRVELNSVSALGWRINAICVTLSSVASMRAVCPPHDRLVSLTPGRQCFVFVMNCVALGGAHTRLVILVSSVSGTLSGSVYSNAEPGDLGRLVVIFANPALLYALLS
jgi:hypothetical protein